MNKSPFSLLDPQELASRVKEDSVLLSLRVKPSVKQYFEELASKDKGLSVNNLINELLESYVKFYQSPENTNPQSTSSIMREYLHSVADRIAHYDDEVLLTRFFNNQHLNIQTPDGNSLDYSDTITELNAVKYDIPCASLMAVASIRLRDEYITNEDKDKDDTSDIESPDSFLLMLDCTKQLPSGKHAKFDPNLEFAKTEEDKRRKVRIIKVSPAYWAIVLTIINSYLDKIREFNPDSQVIVTQSFAHTLTNTINESKDRTSLAKNLADVFATFLEVTLDD